MSEAWKRVSGWSEGGDDGPPNFGKKARRWFNRSLRASLGLKLCGDRVVINDEEMEPLLERLSADPMLFVTWKDDDEYRGRRYSNGAWTIDWDAVVRGAVEALEEIRAEEEAARFPTLDDWLRAEVAGTLDSSAALGGSAKLPKKLRRELLAAARARRKDRPRICRTCRAEFMPTSNRALRCSKCINPDSMPNPVNARTTDRRSR